MAYTAEQEAAMLRQDLIAANDMLRLVQADCDALRQSTFAIQREHARVLATQQEATSSAESKVRELRAEIEVYKAENEKVRAELAETLSDRERQASMLGNVRRAVDGRLTKLMDELHAKDEELHRLRYLAGERDRDREHITMLEKMLGSREENINDLLAQLSTARAENAQSQAELRHVTMLAEQHSRAIERLSASPSRLEESQPKSPSSELAAIIPLYRQWTTEFRNDLGMIDDAIESIMDSATDLRVSMETGEVAIPNHDRQRLQAMRRIEKERAKAQAALLASTASANDDQTVVHVHTIRSNCDQIRHEATKVKENISALGEMLEALKPLARGTSAVTTSKGQVASSQGVVQEQQWWQEALAAKDEKCSLLEKEMFELREKRMEAESSAKASERESQRLAKEVEALKASLARAESEIDSLRSLQYDMRERHYKEVDEARKAANEMSANSQRSLEAALENSKAQMESLASRYQDDMRQAKDEIASLKSEKSALAESEAKLHMVLEESRTKRLELKHEREQLEKEVGALRSSISIKDRELHQAQEIISSLSQELQHVKSVLDFEMTQKGRENLGLTSADHAFDEWRNERRPRKYRKL